MGIVTTSNLGTSVRTRYRMHYEEGAEAVRTFDQAAGVINETDVPRGSSVTLLVPTELQPRPTTAVQSQTADITPQTFSETSTTVSFEYYADAIN